MNVYCYHEPLIPGFNEGPLIEFWKQTWADRGWSPVVLGVEDFRRHPLAEKFEAKVSQIPTANARDYELACYRRWLAMATVGGGVLVDYDILNRYFCPGHLPPLGGMFILGWPTPAYGDAEAFEAMCHLFMFYRLDVRDVYADKPHASDMTIVERVGIGSLIQRSSRCVANYKGPGWEIAPLVHYSNVSCEGQLNKLSVINATFKRVTINQ